MMKVLHSADWHLGAPMARWGDELRPAHHAVPGRIADLVHRHGCDLVLLSGDLFDGPPTPQTLPLLQRALEEMAVPVCIAPGNHDFVTPASPWLTAAFPGNVHIFRTPSLESVTFPHLDCRVYGVGYDSMDCPSLLRGFRAEGAERYALGVLHGDPLVLNSPYCPVTAGQVQESGLDYLALGHIHKTGSFRAGSALCAWPGCPMGRGFDECGEKGVLIVTLGETAETRFVPLDVPRFHELTVPVDTDPRRALSAALPPAAHGDYFRISLTGECPVIDTAALRQQFSQYTHIELIDKTSAPADLWAAVGDDTLEGVYFRLLQEQLVADPAHADRIRLAAKLSRKILDGQEVCLP